MSSLVGAMLTPLPGGAAEPKVSAGKDGKDNDDDVTGGTMPLRLPSPLPSSEPGGAAMAAQDSAPFPLPPRPASKRRNIGTDPDGTLGHQPSKRSKNEVIADPMATHQQQMQYNQMMNFNAMQQQQARFQAAQMQMAQAQAQAQAMIQHELAMQQALTQAAQMRMANNMIQQQAQWNYPTPPQAWAQANNNSYMIQQEVQLQSRKRKSEGGRQRRKSEGKTQEIEIKEGRQKNSGEEMTNHGKDDNSNNEKSGESGRGQNTDEKLAKMDAVVPAGAATTAVAVNNPAQQQAAMLQQNQFIMYQQNLLQQAQAAERARADMMKREAELQVQAECEARMNMMQQQQQAMANSTMQQATAQQRMVEATQAAQASVMDGFSCKLVKLKLPPVSETEKLGVAFHTTAAGTVELKKLSPDSPLIDQIPTEFHQYCCIGSLSSPAIGSVQPKSAQECAEYFAKARAGDKDAAVTMEVLLVQPKRSSQAWQQTPHAQNLATQHYAMLEMQRMQRSSAQPTAQQIAEQIESKWKHQFTALVQHHDKYGHFNVNHRNSTRSLSKWVKEQRKLEKDKELAPDRLAMLNRIGFFQKRQRIFRGSWDEMYESLLRFKERCNLLPRSGELYDWLEVQKEEMNRLMPLQLRKLRELGALKPQETDAKPKEAAVDPDSGGNSGRENSPVNSKKKSKKSPKVDKNASNLFWRSSDAARLFGFARGDDVYKGLTERIEILRQANESADGWKKLVPNDDKIKQYSQNDIMLVRHKALYLIKSYQLALKKMNKKTWTDCCAMAVNELNDIGLTDVSRPGTVATWQASFRKDNFFPHPLRHTKEKKDMSSTQIFEHFPGSKDLFVEIANKYIHQMTAKLMEEKIAKEFLPELERQSRENGTFDDGSPGQNFLVKLLANPPKYEIARKWLSYCNVEYDRYCTQRGRGTSIQAVRMREAWASGKYASRRPKGQGESHGSKRYPVKGKSKTVHNIDTGDEDEVEEDILADLV